MNRFRRGRVPQGGQQADALPPEASTATDEASENLEKQFRRDAKDIKDLAKDLLDD